MVAGSSGRGRSLYEFPVEVFAAIADAAEARTLRTDEPLRRGLPAFGDFIRQAAATRPHLERFAVSRLLTADACAWGAGSRTDAG